MFNYFTKQRVFVKPIEGNNPNTQWGVFEMSILEDLRDDFGRYGIVTMLKNLIWCVKDYYGADMGFY